MYGMFTYIYHENQPNVGKNISYIDPMGYIRDYGIALKQPISVRFSGDTSSVISY